MPAAPPPIDMTDLIDPRHLTAEAIAVARAAFATDRHQSLVIDGFLTADLIAGLRACFAGDAAFAPHYGLNAADAGDAAFVERVVDEHTFGQAPDAALLAREWVMQGSRPGRSGSRGWAAHMRLTRLLASRAFAAYLTEITGIDRLDEMGYMPRIMKHGDFCRVHDDTAERRRLCLLLYVDDDWRPGFGGRFQHMIDGAPARSVEPLGNRLLIHVPARHHLHRVEPFGDTAMAWQRCTYSIWLSSAAP